MSFILNSDYADVDYNTTVEYIDAKKLFLLNNRFDLIFKYIFIKYFEIKNTNFFKDLYFNSIEAFNDFYEYDGSKISKEDFYESFINLIDSIKNNGFNENLGVIPVDENYQILDGAHRLAICAFYDVKVPIVKAKNKSRNFNYDFFNKRNLHFKDQDFGALEYVKLNKNAYIVNLHSITNTGHDDEVENILNKYGFVFYKKNVYLNPNGYLHLKLISYGFRNWNRMESWIGDYNNNFFGARKHVNLTYGNNPLRVFVFVCDDIEKVKLAKSEIRDIYKIDNYSVHINDYHEEAIELAQLYFNDNSIHFVNNMNFIKNDKFNNLFDHFKNYILTNNLNADYFCIDGSSVMSLYGIRELGDLDFLAYNNNSIKINHKNISLDNEKLIYYSHTLEDIIFNNNYHLYYNGIKFISLEVLKKMKENRKENPKDLTDIELINFVLSGSQLYEVVKIQNKIIDENKCEIEQLKKEFYSIYNNVYETFRKLLPKPILNYFRDKGIFPRADQNRPDM